MLTPDSARDRGPEGGGAGVESSARIDQLGLRFTPSSVIVPIGGVVAFTNSETTAHNVHVRYSDTDSTVFDVDTDPGESARYRFEAPGGYDVSCGIHASMRAFVFVSTTPLATLADTDGRFHLPDVAPGTYALSVWSVDPALRVERTVAVGGAVTEVSLRGEG